MPREESDRAAELRRQREQAEREVERLREQERCLARRR